MRYTILLLLSIFTCSLSGQNILTVRQGFDDGTTTFSSIQAAVDAATASSTIYVYPGVYNENVLIDKALRMAGPGYRLNDNYPGASWTSLDADLLGSITITGEEAVLVEGMKLRTVYTTNAASATFQRCWIYRASFNTSTVRVKSVYFAGGTWSSSGGFTLENQIRIAGQSDIQLVNSIFANGYSSAGRECLIYAGINSSGANGTLLIDRCFLYNRMYLGQLAVVIKNSLAYDHGTVMFHGVSYYRYNNFLPSNWGAGNTFLAHTQWSMLTAGFPDNPTGLSFDAVFQLSENSLGRNAADDGGDCGPFGGTSPYVLSGVPALPFIYEFAVPEEGSTGSGLDINVKVRTQN